MRNIIKYGVTIFTALSIMNTLTAFAQSTEVEYDASGVEQYTLTVPALLHPTESGDVILQGTWPSNKKVSVTTSPSIDMYSNNDENDIRKVDIGFSTINLFGNNKQAVSQTERVSVGKMNALFGLYQGTIYYNIDFDGTFKEKSELDKWDYHINETGELLLDELILDNYNSDEGQVIVYPTYTIDGVEYQTVLNSTWISAGNGDPSAGTVVSPFYENAEVLKSIVIMPGVKTYTTQDMFHGCKNLEYADLSGFDASECTIMDSTFYGCENLTSVKLGDLNTSSCKSFTQFFKYCKKLRDMDIMNMDTSNATDFVQMFEGCSSLEILDIRHFDMSKAVNLYGMFADCPKLRELQLPDFSKAENLQITGKMFHNCKALRYLDLGSMKTQKLNNIQMMFNGCINLDTIDMRNAGISKSSNLLYMFRDCKKLKNLYIDNFDTSNVTNFSAMFSGCSSLEVLDLRHFDTRKANQTWDMFRYCTNLKKILVSENWKISDEVDSAYMFDQCGVNRVTYEE